MSGKKFYGELPVTIAGTSEVIPNVYELEKIGAGHDGYIFRFNNQVLKILKYDINLRKQKGLMTFDKASYFKNNLKLQSITQPTDILLNSDGIYIGYVMDYIDNLASEKKRGTPQFREPGDYNCGDLISSWEILEEDFEQLSNHDICVKDINRGSYLYGYDFMHLCDTDKYELNTTSRDLNYSTLNFTMAKFLTYEMKKTEAYTSDKQRILDEWVKKCSGSRTFHQEVLSDIGSDYNSSISKYADYKAKILLR